MLILALDTTTPQGSCALAHDDRVIVEMASEAGRSHAAHLPGDLIALLERAGVSLAAIDIFAVATGPGSFTGLRVGIATMQGLAFAQKKPLIGVSAFDALAAAVTPPAADDDVATWIDAWRGEVYAALYHDRSVIEAPSVEHPSAVLARLAGRQSTSPSPPRRIWFAGNGAATFSDAIRATLPEAVLADPVAPLLAGPLARLACAAAAAGEHPPPDAITPLYIRRIDAELARDARHAR